MKKRTEKEYEDCVKAISDLIKRWELMRPDEELVVMVLPKYDRSARREYINKIIGMLLREDWNISRENGLPRADSPRNDVVFAECFLAEDSCALLKDSLFCTKIIYFFV